MNQKIPPLKEVRVPSNKLVLDPNNPRFITHTEEHIAKGNILDPITQDHTRKQMQGSDLDDPHQIEQLEASIIENGYIEIDRIFVSKLENDRYLVIEGNRRVTAVQNLLGKDNLEKNIRDQIEELPVTEIIGDVDGQDIQDGISYLLGVRHHGSLKKWTPFAQAYNIYLTYLRIAGQDESNFQWDNSRGGPGDEVANSLSIQIKEVKERLFVFRVMRQMSEFDPIKKAGGLKERDYSIIGDALKKTTPDEFVGYFPRDEVSFLLEGDAVERFDNLCDFSNNRSNPTVASPKEWTPLGNILAETDPEVRQNMLEQVELEKIAPSVVWSARAEDIYKIRWEKWFVKVFGLLSSVKYSDNFSAEAIDVLNRMSTLFEQLEEKEPNS